MQLHFFGAGSFCRPPQIWIYFLWFGGYLNSERKLWTEHQTCVPQHTFLN
jgi:hypothetical protein